jgi:hypothetical protein
MLVHTNSKQKCIHTGSCFEGLSCTIAEFTFVLCSVLYTCSTIKGVFECTRAGS